MIWKDGRGYNTLLIGTLISYSVVSGSILVEDFHVHVHLHVNLYQAQCCLYIYIPVLGYLSQKDLIFSPCGNRCKTHRHKQYIWIYEKYPDSQYNHTPTPLLLHLYRTFSVSIRATKLYKNITHYTSAAENWLTLAEPTQRRKPTRALLITWKRPTVL